MGYYYDYGWGNYLPDDDVIDYEERERRKDEYDDYMTHLFLERELEERSKPKMYKVIKNLDTLKKDIKKLADKLEGQDKKDLLDFYNRFEKLESEVK